MRYLIVNERKVKKTPFNPIPSLLLVKLNLLSAQLLCECPEESERIQTSIDGLDREIHKLQVRAARRTG